MCWPEGDGAEEQPLADMRSADARSRQIGRRDGVRCRFQVSRQSVEPRPASRTFSRRSNRSARWSEHRRAGNLLAEDEFRAAGGNEAQESGGEMAVIVLSLAFPGLAEGLAGRRSGPDRPVLGHASEAQCDYLAGLAMTLDVAPGDSGSFGLDDGSGQHFVAHFRLWTDDEVARLAPITPALPSPGAAG